MQTYETIFVTTPTLTEDEEKETVDTFSQIVSDGGGAFAANDRMGRRRLAYPIEKHNDGVYIRFLYDAEAAVPKELERRMRLSDRILRVLTVRMEPKWAAASKEQAVIDAKARVEAAEREELERVEAERKAAEEPEEPETDGESNDVDAAPSAAPKAAPKAAPSAAPKAEPSAEPKAEPSVASSAAAEPTPPPGKGD